MSFYPIFPECIYMRCSDKNRLLIIWIISLGLGCKNSYYVINLLRVYSLFFRLNKSNSRTRFARHSVRWMMSGLDVWDGARRCLSLHSTVRGDTECYQRLPHLQTGSWWWPWLYTFREIVHNLKYPRHISYPDGQDCASIYRFCESFVFVLDC